MDDLALIHSRCIEEGNCWLWQGGLDGHGRPQKRYQGKTVYVRRLVRQLKDGQQIPSTHVVPASCGNRICVSPVCSSVATHQKKAKMAASRGVYNNAAKSIKMALKKRAESWITDELVQQIRVAPGPASRISLETKVSLSHVKAIRRGTARRDISSPFAGLMT